MSKSHGPARKKITTGRILATVGLVGVLTLMVGALALVVVKAFRVAGEKEAQKREPTCNNASAHYISLLPEDERFEAKLSPAGNPCSKYQAEPVVLRCMMRAAYVHEFQRCHDLAPPHFSVRDAHRKELAELDIAKVPSYRQGDAGKFQVGSTARLLVTTPALKVGTYDSERRLFRLTSDVEAIGDTSFSLDVDTLVIFGDLVLPSIDCDWLNITTKTESEQHGPQGGPLSYRIDNIKKTATVLYSAKENATEHKARLDAQSWHIEILFEPGSFGPTPVARENFLGGSAQVHGLNGKAIGVRVVGDDGSELIPWEAQGSTYEPAPL